MSKSTPINRVEDCLADFLTRYPSQRLAVAHSGGGDSTALAGCLVKLGAAGRLLCFYVDHGDRPHDEMQGERDFVLSCWRQWGVTGFMLPAPLTARQPNFEASARRLRYRVLLDALKNHTCDLLLTAHTRDDADETLLMRFFRGGSFWGLRGIPARRGPILRPLLEVSRQEIRNWLEKNNQPFFEDSSNSGGNLRARIRHEMVPVLDRLFPAWRRALRDGARRLVPQKTWSWALEGTDRSMPREDWERLNPEQRLDALLEVYRGNVTIRRGRLRGLLQQGGGFRVEGWCFRTEEDKIVWGPEAEVVNLVKYKYFLVMKAGSCQEWEGRYLRIDSLEGLPETYCLVSPLEGDRWKTPEGSPSLTTVLKRCRSSKVPGVTCHYLVAGGRVYGVLASPWGGQDWAYCVAGKSIWQWEANERFQQQ